jgi:hypothetical protein
VQAVYRLRVGDRQDGGLADHMKGFRRLLYEEGITRKKAKRTVGSKCKKNLIK